MENEISSLTKRFVACIADLKSRNIIKTDVEVATAIDYPKANLSSVLKGKRNIPYKYAFAFAKQYQIPNFFDGQDSENSDSSIPEPISVRPYNLPVVIGVKQDEYIKRYDDTQFVKSLTRYPILKNVDNRGAEWRWFESAENLTIPGFFTTDLLLCRLIHSEDYKLQEIGKKFIILTTKELFISELVDKTKARLIFQDIEKKQRSVLLKTINELWIARKSVVIETTPFYKDRPDYLD